MNAETAKVVVESRLVLNQRELSLLNHICSYAFESKDFAKNRVSSSYNGGVTEKEINDFVQDLRAVTTSMMSKIEIESAEMFKKRGGKDAE